MALEIDPHAALKGVLADQGVQHPDHLGALLVHRGRVEVVDLHVAFRPDRMRERARILEELRRPQTPDVGDPLDRRANVDRR